MNAPNHPSDSGHVFCRKLYSVSCCNVAALSGWAREGGYFLLHGGALNSNSELHTAIASLQPNTRRPKSGALSRLQYTLSVLFKKRCSMQSSHRTLRNEVLRRYRQRLTRLVKQFVQQDAAAFYSVELVLIGSIACIGLVVGLAEYRNSLVQEYGDVSGAIAHLDQSFSFTLTASSGAPASTSSYSDTMVYAGGDANGITVNTPPSIDSE